MIKEEFKKFKGKRVKVVYLNWGDVGEWEGILERINKESIVVGGKLIKNKGLDIEAVMEDGKWIETKH